VSLVIAYGEFDDSSKALYVPVIGVTRAAEEKVSGFA